MTQQSLFPDDRYKPVRSTDPATSHAAAKLIAPDIKTHAGRMLFVWRRIAGTSNEIAAECVKQFGGNHETYRKRNAELQRAGLIRKVSTRLCMVTNYPADVFEGKPE